MLGTLLVIARMCAGGFFVWTGSAKLSRSRHFWSQIMGYKIVGPRQARLLAAALPPVEFVAGLFFAAGLWPAVTGCVLLLLLAAFTAAIASSLLRGLENDCGCAGAIASHRSSSSATSCSPRWRSPECHPRRRLIPARSSSWHAGASLSS
ncbi:MauE/DoxX family redox-associated membrane protein [Clavibacter michiganensis]|uniref:MauE/DoxX family redox-associated membrane protein n=1 Tax=Clavibacter michiganensis TaxID=28447 RepID=UPI001198241C